MKAAPLLKFKDDVAHLAPEGVEVIKGITGNVCPVILIGDGRAGKSYLGSRIVNSEDAFESSDSAESVTEGIDVVAVPVAELLRSYGLPGGEDVPPGEHLIVLDCEGGNNAMASIHSLVNVFGIVVGTEVLFVANGMASEQALQNLGMTLAARSMIRLDGAGALTEQHLVFAVNKNTLKYMGSALEKILNQQHSDAGRRELRETISAHFPERSFFAVPLIGMPNFEQTVQELRAEVLKNRRPLTIGGEPVDGPKLSGLLELIVQEIRKSNEISLPSMSRFIVYDSFLRPLVEEIVAESKGKIPVLDDYHSELSRLAPHADAESRFEKEAGHVKQTELMKEARELLHKELDILWTEVVRRNELVGEQVVEIKDETRENVLSQIKVAIGGRGLLKRVVVTKKTISIETRAAVYKKKGGEPEISDWKESGGTRERLLETCFEPLWDGRLPVLKGSIQKQSPNFLRTLFDKRKQSRMCVLRDGHFMWWDEAEIEKKGEAKGCISFIVHRAEVFAGTDPNIFGIRPQKGKQWKQTEEKAFTGKSDREFLFDAEGGEITRDEWVEAIEVHIAFGDGIDAELGEEKSRSFVKTCKPTLKDVEQ